ncbi:T9SS type B sorting domain-containing protein [Leptobacterium flavescens]|uniref:T9SS type B sorting domain-containing protein n=1 Tax=Leptobacterium flavescens TaxID=472055 RepID=A0A6P0UQ83_9FLAO|nr:T9SS type B sorting domain-containing protein [Leptobacterium flavescens]NER15501.1 T9SS type B sorting domain-containing protein [Leptobacterium flavescens]
MKYYILIFFLAIGFSLQAQAPNDCVNAIIVCSDTNLELNSNGIGIDDFASPGSNPPDCSFTESQSLWLKVIIETSGTLAFVITPESNSPNEDYDFAVYGPNVSCDNLGSSIRCSSTNPPAAGVPTLTGMRDSETDTSEGPGPAGNGFVQSLNVNAGEEYYILVDNFSQNGGFTIDFTGTAGFPDVPFNNVAAGTSIDLEECDTVAPLDDGMTNFDLEQNTPLIIGTQTGVSVTYHDNMNDASAGVNALTSPYLSTSTTQRIYARITNDNSECFDITDFELRTIPGPIIATPSDFELCDLNRDGTEQFDLTTTNTETLNGLTPSDFAITYHASQADADTNSSALPSNYDSVGETIFVRVEDISAGCFSTVPLNLILNPLPPANASVLLQCDVDSGDSTDGITMFNLEQAYDDITSATPGLNLEFFETNADLAADNPIANPIGYQNTTAFNQFILVRVTDTNSCQDVAQLELIVQPTTASLPSIGPFFACDIDPEDAILQGSFDLDAIKNNNYPPTLDIAFYTNLNDASLELNPVSGTDFITESTTLFVRIENANQCQGVEQFQLRVDPTPSITFPEQINFCLNQPAPSVFGPFGFDIYRWFRRNPGGADTLVFEGTNFSIPAPGEYRLEAISVFNDFGVTRMCSNSVNFTAAASNIATIRDIEIRDLSSNNTITVLVDGEGDYEYALNDITGPYQDSNVFENLPPGFATVYVRDRNGCGISEREVSIIGFPKFFTPNGDGVNESWQLLGVDQQFQPNSIIFIFDRFGKLVKQLRPGGEGWNGTFNGRPLPSSDYWFRAVLEDGRDFTGHFALKR